MSSCGTPTWRCTWPRKAARARYQLFEPAMHDTALRRLELSAAMQRAIDHDEFISSYQPVIELQTGKIDGCRGADPLVRTPRRGSSRRSISSRSPRRRG